MIILSTAYLHRRLARQLTARNFDATDNETLSSTHHIETFDISQRFYSVKDIGSSTKTQIKVILTVVVIISLIMLIITIFRFKNSCRNHKTDQFQTEILRNRTAQHNEPSSRRGSVGYYTRRYSRSTVIRSNDHLNIAVPVKRLSVPACDHSARSTAVIILSSPSVDSTVTTDATHHHVTSSCDAATIPSQARRFITSPDLKPVSSRSDCTISLNQCDDQTPLLRSELACTIKDFSNHTARKYSLNALLPRLRPSSSHPLCSSLTSTNAAGTVHTDGNDTDLKSRRRVSLSSALRRSSFAKQPRIFCSTIDSVTTTKTASPPTLPIDSDGSDHLTNQSLASTQQQQQQRVTSSRIPPKETTSLLSSYRKDFMHKIERFRFIDDSASSTTTVTSPVESIDRPCSHLITSAIEQFDDYVRTKYNHQDTDDVDSLIDRLNSDTLTNGSYSDLNILHRSTPPTKPLSRPQTFKPIHETSFQPATNLSGCRANAYRQSMPINIPHSITSFPLSKQRHHQGESNGHSRSMDFQSLATKREFQRPVTLISTIHETSSSSSTVTLASMHSSTSLEFADNTKPSGVLVDDDFLPMSSPVDEHFWNVTINRSYGVSHKECFPNVGSSPDVEVKHFDLTQSNAAFSEISCDEDDDSTSSTSPPELFSTGELSTATVPLKSTASHREIFETVESEKVSANPSINSTEQSVLDQSTEKSFLEKFSRLPSIPVQSELLSDHLPLKQLHSDDDDTQESSPDDESADNGEIDLAQEFEFSQKEERSSTNHQWPDNDHDVFIIQEDPENLMTPPIAYRTLPTSIMKMANNKTLENIDEQQQQVCNTLKPKVRFNLDPQYEREREWNKVNKLLGNSVEWTDEFEV